MCHRCGRSGHYEPSCRTNLNNMNRQSQPIRAQPLRSQPSRQQNPQGNQMMTTNRACFECGGTDHFKRYCPKLNQGGSGRQTGGQASSSNPARGRAFVMGANEARQDPSVVTGTFLVSDHYASVLFDTGADRSFVSVKFLSIANLPISDHRTLYRRSR